MRMDSFIAFKLLCSYSWHVRCCHTLVLHGILIGAKRLMTIVATY